MASYAASLLAIVASASLTLGLYFMKREADRLPSLAGGWRLSAWWAFARDPWWVLGLALQIVGFALYVLALRWAPISVVHTALNGGIALFVILSVIGLGERPRRVEWAGVVVITIGLVLLSLSLSSDATPTGIVRGMLPFSLTLLALCVLGFFVDRAPRRAVGLSVASGLFLGLGSVYTKCLANASALAAVGHSVYLPLAFGANFVGFVLMQAALQAGRGVVVMPVFSTLSNLVPIVGGFVVFDEALPGDGAAAVLRPLAFVLALGGAALLAAFGERAPQPGGPRLTLPGAAHDS